LRARTAYRTSVSAVRKSPLSASCIAPRSTRYLYWAPSPASSPAPFGPTVLGTACSTAANAGPRSTVIGKLIRDASTLGSAGG